MTLVVDASAIVAVGMDEPERSVMVEALSRSDDAVAAAINVVEAGIVLVLRFGRFTPEQYAEWLSELGVQERRVDGAAALRAYLQYGRGVHRAGLNLGDCFAYALAKELDAPLLYKGDDFGFTDVRSALQPT
jgi:ribonuclease VapC